MNDWLQKAQREQWFANVMRIKIENFRGTSYLNTLNLFLIILFQYSITNVLQYEGTVNNKRFTSKVFGGQGRPWTFAFL